MLEAGSIPKATDVGSLLTLLLTSLFIFGRLASLSCSLGEGSMKGMLLGAELLSRGISDVSSAGVEVFG